MRKVEFPPDGHRIIANPVAIVQTFNKYASVVPAKHAFATALHESSYSTNEIDTEPPDADGHCFVSKGIYQLSDEEAKEVDFPDANLLDLEDSSCIFALLCERRLGAIISAAGLIPQALPDDVWAMLSVAHNQGLSACLKSIKLHGLDWEAYVDRNRAEAAAAGDPDKIRWWESVFAYGHDCMTGGPDWTEALAAL